MRRQDENVVTVAYYGGGLVVLLILIGYCMNVYDIVAYEGEYFTPMMVARLVGLIVVPLGGILGWF